MRHCEPSQQVWDRSPGLAKVRRRHPGMSRRRVRKPARPYPGDSVPHRCSAAVACSAAALLVAAAGASSASAASVSPKVTLATSNQTALLATRAAVVTLATPADSVATVALYADGHRVSAKRRLVTHHARHLRQVLTLTSDGLALAAPVRGAEARSAHDPPARVADHDGSHASHADARRQALPRDRARPAWFATGAASAGPASRPRPPRRRPRPIPHCSGWARQWSTSRPTSRWTSAATDRATA